MKRKNILLAIALLISGLLSVNGAFAQEKSDNVTLNIVLKPIQTITVNPASKSVNIIYDDITDYEKGVTTGAIKDHLTVYSTGGFTVNVKSDGDFVNTNDNTNKIAAGDVKITAEGSVGTFYEVALATSEGSESNLISSDKGGRDLKYSVTYDNTSGANDAYINHYLNGGDEKNTFTATVTYTIAAK